MQTARELEKKWSWFFRKCPTCLKRGTSSLEEHAIDKQSALNKIGKLQKCDIMFVLTGYCCIHEYFFYLFLNELMLM